MARFDAERLRKHLVGRRARPRRPRSPVQRSLDRVRLRLGRSARSSVDGVLDRISSAAQRGLAHPERAEVDVVRDVPYIHDGCAQHRLDIYRPVGRVGPWPVLLYVHGGGFALLSKDTHWMMAQAYAQHGFLVFTINYRLAPEFPYPAAIEDTCTAYRWVLEHAASYGGDLGRVVVAGESAGANLVTALSVASCYARPEPWARAVYRAGRVPDVAVPACGLFQVTEIERFWSRRRMPAWVRLILAEVSAAYLRGCAEAALADPLVLLEGGAPPARDLPAFFIPVGTRDPLLDDTRRLARALRRHGVDVVARYYRREIHAFHATLVTPGAKAMWRDSVAFIDQHLHRASRRTGTSAAGSEDAA